MLKRTEFGLVLAPLVALPGKAQGFPRHWPPKLSWTSAISDLHGPWSFQFDEAVTNLALDRQY